MSTFCLAVRSDEHAMKSGGISPTGSTLCTNIIHLRNLGWLKFSGKRRGEERNGVHRTARIIVAKIDLRSKEGEAGRTP